MRWSRPGCDTGPMNKAEIANRWRAGLAAMKRDSGPTPRLTTWTWTVDAFIAAVLAVGSLSDALNRGQHANSLAGPYVTIPHPARVPGRPHVIFDQYPSAQWWQLLLAV